MICSRNERSVSRRKDNCSTWMVLMLSIRALQNPYFSRSRTRGGSVLGSVKPRLVVLPFKKKRHYCSTGSVLVVTEAGIRSGTMTTAEANRFRQNTACNSGINFSPTSAGTNRLISEGARIISDESSLAVLLLDFGTVARAQKTKLRLKSHYFRTSRFTEQARGAGHEIGGGCIDPHENSDRL